ncbi:MAG: PHP domain-containing protein, partial [Dehalococcoidia bacterium]
MLRADLHIHTLYSSDCLTSPEEVVARCLEIGINCLAVTDHDSVAGAQRVQELAPFPVIVGEEILTPQGEIMGLFLTRRIPSGLPVREVVAQIKEQGGLVCVPHPFDQLRLSIGRDQTLLGILPDIDIVEVFNSRSLMPFS